MMNPASEDIKDILLAESSIDLTAGTDFFIGKEPSNPAVVTTIYDTPAPGLELFQDNGEYLDRCAIQICHRNIGYPEGWDFLRTITELLHGRAHETWNSTHYQLIQCAGSLSLLDWVDKERVRFIQNFTILRSASK